MEDLQTLIYLLDGLLIALAVPRAIYCIVKIATDAEQKALYSRRLRNLIVFLVAALCFFQLISIIAKYYRLGPVHGGGSIHIQEETQ